MRHNCYRWIVVLAMCTQCCIGASFAQPAPPQKQAPEHAPFSVRVGSADKENVGKVADGTVVSRTITVQNILKVPIRMRVVERSCGCLGAVLDKDELKPGEVSTLVLSATVAPVMEQQRQAAIVESTWVDESGEKSERVAATISYSADIVYEVFPDKAFVRVVRGETTDFELIVKWASVEKKSAPVFSRARASLPCIQLTPLPSHAKGALRYRVSCSGLEVGMHSGEIELGSNDTQALRVPVRIDVRDRVMGSAMFVHSRSKTASTKRIVLSHPAAGVKLEPSTHAVSVVLKEQSLTITLDTTFTDAGCGTTDVLLLDTNGVVIGKVPVVWWTADGER